jgi:hypothetical protein
MQGTMTTLAALAIRAGPDEYWKVVCIEGSSDLPTIAGVPQSDPSTAPHARRGTADGD